MNDNHNDWDLHLPAVVYGINTAKQVLCEYVQFRPVMMFCSHGTPRNDGQETHLQVSTKDHILCPASLPKGWPLSTKGQLVRGSMCQD